MTENLEQQSQATESQATSEPQAFVIPEAYKDKGWVEKVKSPDDLWKLTDNAQSLLGKRPAGIPANDAPDADWEAFYKASRPESADKYALSDIEGLPEGTDLTPIKAKAQAVLFEAGLTPKQADIVWKQYVAGELASAKELSDSLDKRYDDAAKVLGDKREVAEKIAQDGIKAYVREELRGSFVNNPEGMVAMIELANGYEAELARVKAEYGAEGKLPNGGEQVAATDIGETVSKLAKLRMSPEAQDFTKAGHKKVMDEITALQAVVARHYNK